jgi:DNA-binding protein Alba
MVSAKVIPASHKNDKTSDSIPPSMLVIGRKNASTYLAPAIFRITNLGKLTISAKGRLSIVTAVDVAEIIKRSINTLICDSIKIGTEEIIVDGSNKRRSWILIELTHSKHPWQEHEKQQPQISVNSISEGQETNKKMVDNPKKRDRVKKKSKKELGSKIK